MYDFNAILRNGIVIVGISGLILYQTSTGSNYLNDESIFYFILLCLQSLFFLWFEKRRRDPFLIILVLNTLLFYMLRVVTLLISEFSIYLTRDLVNCDDINKALLFIIFSNFAIFSGLALSKKNIFGYNKISNIEIKVPNSKFLIIFFLIIIILNLFFIKGSENILGRFSYFISGIFANIYVLILLLILYFYINSKSLTLWLKISLVIVVMIFVIGLTIIGSRSGMITIFIYLFLAQLAIFGKFLLKRMHFIYGIFLFAIAILLFLSATFVRTISYDQNSKISVDRIKTAMDFSEFFAEEDPVMLLNPIFDRTGYLDYATSLIKREKDFREVINPIYYFKSIVDNILTPGFDVFDTPKSANSLRFIYSDISKNPTHADVIEEYSSDMFTVYGEFYILFGKNFSLLFLFIFSFGFKYLFNNIYKGDHLDIYFYKVLLLLNFYYWLNSFGLDWIPGLLVELLVPYFIFRNVFKRNIRWI